MILVSVFKKYFHIFVSRKLNVEFFIISIFSLNKLSIAEERMFHWRRKKEEGTDSMDLH